MSTDNQPIDYGALPATETIGAGGLRAHLEEIEAQNIVTNPEAAASALEQLAALPEVPDPRENDPRYLRPVYPFLTHPAVRLVLKMDQAAHVLTAPIIHNAGMSIHRDLYTGLDRGRYNAVKSSFGRDTSTEAIQLVAYLHALTDAGLVITGRPQEQVEVQPVVPGVGTLALVSAYHLHADARAWELMGETTRWSPDYPADVPGGVRVWPVLLPGVEYPDHTWVAPLQDGDLPGAADVTVTTGPINAEFLAAVVSRSGVSVAPASLTSALGLDYHGPGEDVDTSITYLRQRHAETEPEQYADNGVYLRDLLARAQGQAITSLMVDRLVKDNGLEDTYPWAWGTYVDYGQAVEDILETEAVVAQADKDARLERIRRERESAGLTAGVSLVLPTTDAAEDLTLVPHLVARGTTTVVTGPMGGGKSAVLRELAATISTPGHEFGRRLPAAYHGRVLLFDLENNMATITHYRREGDGLDNAVIIPADAGISQPDGTTTPLVNVLTRAADGNQPALESLVAALKENGPYAAVAVDGFKRLVQLAGYTERQEERASGLLTGLQDLATCLVSGGRRTLIVSTHTTQDQNVTSGVALDRYADVVVRLTTSARRGHVPGPRNSRYLESMKRADLAGGPLERTRLHLQDGALVLAETPVDAENTQRGERDPLEAAVLQAAPAAGEPGLGKRQLSEAAADIAGVGYRQFLPVLDRLVAAGELTDQAPAPFKARPDYVYYSRT